MGKFKVFKSKIKPASGNFAFNIRNYVNYSRFLVIVTTILFTLGGTYYAVFLTPNYKTTAILSSQVYNALSAQSLREQKDLPLEDRQTQALREAALLQSNQILSRVIHDLRLNIQVDGGFGRRRYLRQLPIHFQEMSIPNGLDFEEIAVRITGNESYRVEVQGTATEAKINEDTIVKLKDLEPIQICLTFENLEKKECFRIRQIPSDLALKDITDNLEIETPGIDEMLITNLIKVSFTGMDPKLIAEIVNAIVYAAVEQSKADEKLQAKESFELLAIQRDQVNAILKDKEEELAALQLKLNQIGLADDVDAKLLANQIEELDKNIVLHRAEKMRLLQTYTERHPNIRGQVAALKSYKEARQELQKRINQTLGLSNMYLTLKRELTVYGELYRDLSAQMQQFLARYESPVGNLRVVQAAPIPNTPISYSKPVIIALSALIGVICGYIVSLVLD